MPVSQREAGTLSVMMKMEKHGGMLVYEDVAFHGVAELRKVPGLPGLQVQRVPEQVRVALNEKAAKRMLAPDGAEIRFVSKSDTVEVTLSCPTTTCEMIAFWGGFQDNKRHVIGNEPTTIRLTYPERVAQLRPGVCDNCDYSPNVWRLTLRGLDKHATLQFHDIQGQGLRPPNPDELPARTYLAYGTSITDGFSATAMHLTYIAQTAHRLGVNLINLGSAGSAWCEPQLADYIAARTDWDFATLAISLNMIGGGFTVEQFRKRAGYMIDTIAGADQTRPVVCITLWPYYADVCMNLDAPTPDQPSTLHQPEIANEYRQVLRELVEKSSHPNLHLLSGDELLRDIDGYTIDLTHPGDAGMIQIGQHLAKKLRPITAG